MQKEEGKEDLEEQLEQTEAFSFGLAKVSKFNSELSEVKLHWIVCLSPCYKGWHKHLNQRFTPNSDQFQISPAASPEILHHTVWRTCLFKLTQMKHDCTSKFSLHHLYFSIWEGWENVLLFERGSERVKEKMCQ